MKKKIVFMTLLLVGFVLVGCGQTQVVEQLYNEDAGVEEVVSPEVIESVAVSIYHGNAQADGFETKEVNL